VSQQLLEALHQVESNASPDACIANLEGSGATGPFQFKPATFALFGVDANHDGAKDICGFVDSLFSAARYLHAIGADDDPSSETTRRALKRYGTDAERVVSLARAYQERDGLLALAPAAMRE
jgi:membrane-bound lytic murein transglycosylase B